MRTLSKDIIAEQLKQTLPLLLALIAAGLAGNYFKFPLFPKIDFIFGSIFAMLALQYCGFGRGILAAAIISSYTYILWNNPYAIIIMTAEVAVVGYLMKHRKMGMVLADALYWLIIGMPLCYLFYQLAMHLALSNTFIIMVKQAINGITNALVARLIFTGLSLRSRSSLTSYRELVYNFLALFVLLPTMIMLVTGSRADFSETDRQIRSTLMHDIHSLELRLETWVKNRKSAIINLAEMAATRSPQQMQPYVEYAKKSDLNFRLVGLMDRNAITTAFYPLVDELGKSNIGKNYADRPYIAQLKQTLKPMLSDIAMSRVGIPLPRVLVLAPVVMQGEYGGYAIGSLSLEQIKEHLDKNSEFNASLYSLLDSNGNVIMTNRTDQKVLTPFARAKGTLNRLDQHISQWMPTLPPNTSLTESWQRSFYFAEAAIGDLAEWKLILEQPVAPFQKTLYDKYTGRLTLLFVILLGALVLAELLSRKIVGAIEQLRTLTHELPARLASTLKVTDWPESGIKETAHLINNFRVMADSLTEQFYEVRQINESLEQRVEERTEELQRVEETIRLNEERLRLALSSSQQGWFDLDIPTGAVTVSPEYPWMIGYDPAEFDSSLQTWINALHPEDRDAVLKKFNECLKTGLTRSMEYRRKTKTGEWKWLRSIGQVISFDSQGKPLRLIGTHADISEYKQADMEREQFFRFFQTSADIMVIADPNGAFLKTNPACSELLGYSAEELVDKPFVDFIHPDDKQPTLDEMARQQQIGFSLNFENRYACKDGSFKWMSWRAIFNKEEGITYATARDITERKLAEEEIKRSLKEKEVLLKEIHHRVKNNMQVIYSLLNLQAKGIPEKEVRAMFEETRNRVHSMALIHEKLYRSTDLAHIDFKEYLTSLVAGIADTYKRHDVVLSVEMEPMALDVNIGIPCGLIVNELVSNCLKYAFPEKRKGTIKVGIIKNSEGNNVLTVSDNGVGFPETLDFRNTASLGLQLVNVLTSQIRGTIELMKEEGTMFKITFPGDNSITN